MRVNCRIDAILLGPRTIGLMPRHPRFVEDAPGTELTVEIDIENSETVEFEIHDFTDPNTGLHYEVHINRFIDDDQHTIVETWERDDTRCISGEYHLRQVINLMVTATPQRIGFGQLDRDLRDLLGECTIRVCLPDTGDPSSRPR